MTVPLGLAVDLLALDIAGTTLDEGGTVYRVLHEVVAEAGSAAGEADIRHWMGADKRTAIRALLGADTHVEAVFQAFNTRLADAYRAEPPQPFPGVPDALARLRAEGVKVALTTGFDHAITDPLLEAAGWASGVLDAVVCTDDVPAGRPAPYLIHTAMQRTGVRDVARVLAAGDTVLDLQAGTNAGCGFVVGVLTGGQTAAELGAVRHTHLLAGVADLPALLGLS